VKVAGLCACACARRFKLTRDVARQEITMVKERKHGNREAKKPKAIKQPAAPTASSMLTGSLTPIKPIKKAQ
jgi:hypothetical protein